MKKRKVIITLILAIIIAMPCIILSIKRNNNINENKIDSFINMVNIPEGAVINPEWVRYQTLTEGEKAQQEVIPSEYIFEFQDTRNDTGEPNQSDLPKQYDLRNVNGINYINPVKNQLDLGLCWVFGGIASIESNLLKIGTVNIENPQIFNERAIDYAYAKARNNLPYNYPDSADPIDIYYEEENPYGSKMIGSGGSSKNVYETTVHGIGLQPMEGIWNTYFTESPKLHLNQVFSYSDFALTDYVIYPNLTTSADNATKQKYYNIIKEHIINYGAVSINSIGPAQHNAFSCFVPSSKTNSNLPLLNLNEDCTIKAPDNKKAHGPHVMNIVGWDDNYEQAYCGLYTEGTTRTDLTQSECEQQGGTYHNIQGAWILRNSWGTTLDSGGYLHLAYESEYNEVSGAIRTIRRDFDKEYQSKQLERKYTEHEDATYFIANFKKTNNSEYLKRVIIDWKYNDEATFDIYLKTPDTTSRFIGYINVKYPGLYSLDIDDIDISSNEYSLLVKKAGNSNKEVSKLYAFTAKNNSYSEKKLVANELSLKNYLDTETTKLKFYMTFDNVDVGEKVIFKLLNPDNVDISNKFEQFYSYVILNKIDKEYEIDEQLPEGEYTFEVSLEDGTILYTNIINLEVIKKDISKCSIFINQILTYSGISTVDVLDLELFKGNEELEYGRDYTVTNFDYNAGTHTISINGIGNYTNSLSANYIIKPKNINIQVKNKEIIYGENLNQSVNINDLEIDGIVGQEEANLEAIYQTNYTNSSNVGEYDLDVESINLVDNGDFKKNNYTIDGTTKGKLIVKKAPYEYTIPTGITANQNQTLSQISLPLGFEWMNGNITVNESGNYKARAFNPDDSLNYETYENIDIYVSMIANKTIITPDISISDKTYDGTSNIDTSSITISNLDPSEYTIIAIMSTDTNVGKSTVAIKLRLTDEKFNNYAFEDGVQSKNFTVEYNIIPKKIEKPAKSAAIYTYNGEEQTFSVQNYNADYMNISGNKGTNAGNYNVVISLKNSNYAWNDGSIDDITLHFEIARAHLSVSDNSKDVTVAYDGEEHSIDVSIELAQNMKVRYMDSNEEYTLNEVPKYTAVGSYVTKYKVFIDDNYTEYFGQKTLTIEEGTPYTINNYSVDGDNMYITNIDINTDVNTFTSNITLGYGYGIDVDTKLVNNKNVLYTGGKTKITKGLTTYREYTNVVSGDTDGNGKITYLDYVQVYNHIKKTKHPESNKQLLEAAYLKAADLTGDNKISYLDYVRIYNKIKELKGSNN